MRIQPLVSVMDKGIYFILLLKTVFYSVKEPLWKVIPMSITRKSFSYFKLVCDEGINSKIALIRFMSNLGVRL